MKSRKKSIVFDFTKDLRADIYWFVHVNILSRAYKTEYRVEIMKDDLYRVDFNLVGTHKDQLVV
jgi:hypothetical protein